MNRRCRPIPDQTLFDISHVADMFSFSSRNDPVPKLTIGLSWGKSVSFPYPSMAS